MWQIMCVYGLNEDADIYPSYLGKWHAWLLQILFFVYGPVLVLVTEPQS